MQSSGTLPDFEGHSWLLGWRSGTPSGFNLIFLLILFICKRIRVDLFIQLRYASVTNDQKLYICTASIGTKMFLIEPSWCMQDDVHKWFWVHQWICLSKYIQFDVYLSSLSSKLKKVRFGIHQEDFLTLRDIPDSWDEDREPQVDPMWCPWPYFSCGKRLGLIPLSRSEILAC